MGKENQNEKLPRGYLLAWTSRGVSLAVNVVLLMQITYYATDVVGLSAGMVGTIFLLSKLFDGVTDLFMGYIIDRTRTRWGKARPYELFIVPLWLFTILLFSTPELGTMGKAVYIFVFYSLVNSVCATALMGSQGVLLARSLRHDIQRGKVLAGSGVLIMIFSAVASMILPQLMATWGTQPGGWTKIGLVYAIPLAIIGLFRFIFIKELDVEQSEKEKRLSFKESLQALLQNKYIFIFAGVFLLANLLINMSTIVGTYYFSYIIGNVGLLSLVGMVGLLAPFILLFFPLAMRTIGGLNFVRIGLVVAIIGNLMKYFGGANVGIIVAGQALHGMGSSFITMMGGVYIVQCMEYGEWKTGKRVEGFTNAVTSFCSKIGSGLASAGVGILMGLAGYSSLAATQSASAITAIRALYTLVPAGICIVMLIILHFYDLEKRMPQIKKDLQERRANAIQ